jgi:hypothetical protein
MATRTSRQALAWILSESLRPTRSYRGLCLRAVREAYGVAAMHPTARAAWQAIPDAQRFRSAPPVGVPLYWKVGEYWHIGVSLGSGVCWSTDILRSGRFDVVPIGLLERKWGADYLGWSRLLNGVLLPER